MFVLWTFFATPQKCYRYTRRFSVVNHSSRASAASLRDEYTPSSEYIEYSFSSSSEGRHSHVCYIYPYRSQYYKGSVPFAPRFYRRPMKIGHVWNTVVLSKERLSLADGRNRVCLSVVHIMYIYRADRFVPGALIPILIPGVLYCKNIVFFLQTRRENIFDIKHESVRRLHFASPRGVFTGIFIYLSTISYLIGACMHIYTSSSFSYTLSACAHYAFVYVYYEIRHKKNY